MKKLSTKQIALTGIFLAITIISQFFKNTSVYLTGSIVNTMLLLTVFYCSFGCGLILCIISPLTSFLITGAPIIAACPLIMPGIMLGNMVYCVVFYLIWKPLSKKIKSNFATDIIIRLLGAGFGALLKATAMYVVIVRFIIPTFGKALKPKMVEVASVQFSVTQLITALIGGALAVLFMIRLNKIPEVLAGLNQEDENDTLQNKNS